MKFKVEVEINWAAYGDGEYGDDPCGELSLDDTLRQRIIDSVGLQIMNKLGKQTEGLQSECQKRMADIMDTKVDERMASYIDSFFKTHVQITNQWGKVEREGAIEDLITDRVEGYFKRHVNERGEFTSESYGSFTIAEYYATKYAERVISKRFEGIKKELDKAIGDTIVQQAKEQLGSALMSQIDLTKIIEAAKQGIAP